VAGGPGTDVLTVGGDADAGVGLTADGDHIRTRDAAWVYLSYQDSPGPVEVDLAAGTVRLIGAAVADTITHLTGVPEFYFMYGTDGDDRMSGGDDRDVLFGLAGDDILSGLGGDDGLDGFEGDDMIDGGDGKDSANGGPGSDTCVNAEQVSGCSP
jgi:Ca2+-binding RTX toxin-like protein